MKKLVYKTPLVEVCRMEVVRMMATSVEISDKPADNSEVLTNRDDWSGGIW